MRSFIYKAVCPTDRRAATPQGGGTGGRKLLTWSQKAWGLLVLPLHIGPGVKGSFWGPDILLWKMRGRTDCFEGQVPWMSDSVLGIGIFLLMLISKMGYSRRSLSRLQPVHLGSVIGCLTKCTGITVFWLLASMPRPGNGGAPVPQAPAEDGMGDHEDARGEHTATCTRALLRRASARQGAVKLGKPFLLISRLNTKPVWVFPLGELSWQGKLPLSCGNLSSENILVFKILAKLY